MMERQGPFCVLWWMDDGAAVRPLTEKLFGEWRNVSMDRQNGDNRPSNFIAFLDKLFFPVGNSKVAAGEIGDQHRRTSGNGSFDGGHAAMTHHRGRM
ncbi:MAG: hypothetical protein HKN30_13890 [Sulfitobacter sp.]|nr:hypothetical protein [Sulfitobacter sp.]